MKNLKAPTTRGGRYAGVLIAAVLAVGASLVTASPASAATTYDSVRGNVRSNGQSDGYSAGQCTDFVAWRLHHDRGIDFHNRFDGQHFGNASTWVEATLAARRAGHRNIWTVPSGTSPRAGDVASLNGRNHVAYLISTDVANNRGIVEDSNWVASLTYGTHPIKLSDYTFIRFSG